MNICVIIQARMGSTRLPGKVMKELCEIPVLMHVIRRVRKSKKPNNIVVATTTEKEDDRIVELLLENKVEFFRGSQNDVLDRYYRCAQEYEADLIVRVTSDNPLIDWKLLDEIVEIIIEKKADYSCNNIPSTYPYGLDLECFTFKSLEQAWKKARMELEREHVTPYIRNNKDEFDIVSISAEKNYSHLRWTLDTQEDFEYIESIYKELYYSNNYFRTEDIIEFLEKRKKL